MAFKCLYAHSDDRHCLELSLLVKLEPSRSNALMAAGNPAGEFPYPRLRAEADLTVL